MIRDDRESDIRKHGARIYQLDDGIIIVKQTVERVGGGTSPYAIDGDPERHVDPDQDALLAEAVRDALAGKLERPKEGPSPSREKAREEAATSNEAIRPRGLPLSELPAVLASLPRLSEEEAADFARDLEEARAERTRRPTEDRWAF